MKKIFIVLLVLINCKAFAQKTGDYNYTIGVQGYNLMQLPKILQKANDSEFMASYLNGGIIKFNDNQISFRISGHYLSEKDYKFENQCANCETSKGLLKDFAIKLGFEKNFNYATFQPYFAVDFGYRSVSFNGKTEGMVLNTGTYSSITEKLGGTVSPVLGIKVNVTNQISLFAESSLDLFYSYERQEKILNDAAQTRSFNKYNKFETLINPVSAGIQIHFVNKN